MLKNSEKILWITRPQEDAIHTASILSKYGIQTFIEPLLEIKQVNFLPIKVLQNVQALIFTSSNGVRSFAQQVSERNLRIIAVGENTAKTASLFRFGNIESAGGNINYLIEYIKQFCSPNKGTLLYACAKEVSQDIKRKLSNFVLHNIVVYESKLITKLSTKFIKILPNLDGVLFYSAKTALAFSKISTKYNINTENLVAYSLSSSIEQKIYHMKWRKKITSFFPQEKFLILSILEEMAKDSNK